MKKHDLPFSGFNRREDVRVYCHGFLPHWRQPGCTYFVTFRLADSLPRAVLEELETEKQQWLRQLGLTDWTEAFAKLPKSDRRRFEKHFATKLNEHLDRCHGACVLRDSRCAEVVATALDHFHPTRVITGDFVVMPNHVHVLLRPNEDHALEEILHSIKSYTSNELNKLLGSSGELWQKESFDHIVRDADQLLRIQTYIRRNPEKAKLQEGAFVISDAHYDLPIR